MDLKGFAKYLEGRKINPKALYDKYGLENAVDWLNTYWVDYNFDYLNSPNDVPEIDNYLGYDFIRDFDKLRA